MTLVEEFRAITDELREDRRVRGENFVRDRVFMDRLDAVYDRMSDEEYLEVNNDGWRGWPDQFDARMSAFSRYNALVNELRESRRVANRPTGVDREKLAALEDLFDELTPEDREIAGSEAWRPDLYDERSKR